MSRLLHVHRGTGVFLNEPFAMRSMIIVPAVSVNPFGVGFVTHNGPQLRLSVLSFSLCAYGERSGSFASARYAMTACVSVPLPFISMVTPLKSICVAVDPTKRSR